jgi:hypothetical protein
MECGMRYLFEKKLFMSANCYRRCYKKLTNSFLTKMVFMSKGELYG